MKITVSTIKGQWPANFGKTRVSFTSSDYEDGNTAISGFFQRVPQLGDVIEGEVVKKGQYTNFEFPKKSAYASAPPAGDLNRVELKVNDLMTYLKTMKPLLDDVHKAVVKKEDSFDPF